MSEPAQFESLITYLAKALVDHPDQVALRTSVSEAGRLYELQVAPEDVGKVIGRDGRTINAMRTLLAVATHRKGERARLEIIDDRRTAQRAGPTPPSGAPEPGTP